MVTKDDERKALKKIQKIVAELGDDSYVATALAGTLEDAEHNIEDDASYSYKDRYETSQRDLARATADLFDANQKIKDLEATALSREQLIQARKMLHGYYNHLIYHDRNYKELIIKLCGEPEDDAFKDTVIDFKANEQRLTTTTELIKVIDNII